MVDWRAAAAALLSTLSVFSFFALPLLRELYGPEILVGFYGVVSIAVGVVVYLVVNRGIRRLRERHRSGPTSASSASDDQDENTVNDPDVQGELETLKREKTDGE